MHLLAQVTAPQLTPCCIVTIDTRRAEPGDDTLPISRRRRSARGIVVVGRFFVCPGDTRLPEQLAGAPVETHHRTPVLGSDGLSDEDPRVPNDGRGIPP